MERHLTRAELARLAGVSERTVDRWLRRYIPSFKLGPRAVRIAESDASTFLQQRRLVPAEAITSK